MHPGGIRDGWYLFIAYVIITTVWRTHVTKALSMAYKAVDYHPASLHNTSNIIPSWWCVQAVGDSKRQYKLLQCQWQFHNSSVLNNNANNLKTPMEHNIFHCLRHYYQQYDVLMWQRHCPWPIKPSTIIQQAYTTQVTSFHHDGVCKLPGTANDSINYFNASDSFIIHLF
jgi:hypothetical protein